MSHNLRVALISFLVATIIWFVGLFLEITGLYEVEEYIKELTSVQINSFWWVLLIVLILRCIGINKLFKLKPIIEDLARFYFWLLISNPFFVIFFPLHILFQLALFSSL